MLPPPARAEAQAERAASQARQALDVVGAQITGGELHLGDGGAGQGEHLAGAEDAGVDGEELDLRAGPAQRQVLQRPEVGEEGGGGPAEGLVAVDVEAGAPRSGGQRHGVPLPVVEPPYVLGVQGAVPLRQAHLVQEPGIGQAQGQGPALGPEEAQQGP